MHLSCQTHRRDGVRSYIRLIQHMPNTTGGRLPPFRRLLLTPQWIRTGVTVGSRGNSGYLAFLVCHKSL